VSPRISRVLVTEIDFQTYLQQVTLVFNGQRDYARLFGDTGPLVCVLVRIDPSSPISTPSEASYPAGHVRLHLALKRLLAATSLPTIQSIYAALYLVSQYITALIYYRSRGIPNYVLFLLPLSKRLHSIYMLRLFNDCWASTAALAAVYSYSVGNELTGTILFRCVIFPSSFLISPYLP
jgi:alpha-1,3-mannosyltransferase